MQTAASGWVREQVLGRSPGKANVSTERPMGSEVKQPSCSSNESTKVSEYYYVPGLGQRVLMYPTSFELRLRHGFQNAFFSNTWQPLSLPSWL